MQIYGKIISTELNDFLDQQDLFANATLYNIGRFNPLMMIKLSFAKELKEIVTAKEFVDDELKKIEFEIEYLRNCRRQIRRVASLTWVDIWND